MWEFLVYFVTYFFYSFAMFNLPNIHRNNSNNYSDIIILRPNLFVKTTPNTLK